MPCKSAGYCKTVRDCGTRLSHAEVQAICRSVGIPEDKLAMMSAIATAESGRCTGKINGNDIKSDGNECSIGLFQINHDCHREYTREQLLDPYNNARVAKRLIGTKQGLRHWTVYKTGTYAKYMPEANKALGVPTAPPTVDYAGGGSTVPPPPPSDSQSGKLSYTFIAMLLAGGIILGYALED